MTPSLKSSKDINKICTEIQKFQKSLRKLSTQTKQNTTVCSNQNLQKYFYLQSLHCSQRPRLFAGGSGRHFSGSSVKHIADSRMSHSLFIFLT
jgi:hypothetical protein